jgi:hypothetical protein
MEQMEEPTGLTFDKVTTEDGVLVKFNGEVDETADFSTLGDLSGKVAFDLEKIERFNSEGIRRWVTFIRGLDQVSELVLEKCSVPVVAQLNLIRGLKGRVWVKSFYIPYVCVETGEEEVHLLYADDVKDPSDPPMPDAGPGKTLELDDVPERYFSFLRDFTKPS